MKTCTFRSSIWLFFKPVWPFLTLHNFSCSLIFVTPASLSLYISYIDVIYYVSDYSLSSIFGCLNPLFVGTATYGHLPTSVSVTFHCARSLFIFHLWDPHGPKLRMLAALNQGCFAPEVSVWFCSESGTPRTWNHLSCL